MNSYGSVSRVSEAIYKMLRYMNFLSPHNNASDSINFVDVNDTRIIIRPVQLDSAPETQNPGDEKNAECVQEVRIAIS